MAPPSVKAWAPLRWALSTPRARLLHNEPTCHGAARRLPRGPHRQSKTWRWNILPMDRFTLVLVKSDDAIDFDPHAVSGSLATAGRGQHERTCTTIRSRGAQSSRCAAAVVRDGTLDKDELAFVQQHLSECVVCQREVQWLRELRAACVDGEAAPGASAVFRNLRRQLDEPRAGRGKVVMHPASRTTDTRRTDNRRQGHGWPRLTKVLRLLSVVSESVVRQF